MPTSVHCSLCLKCDREQEEGRGRGKRRLFVWRERLGSRALWSIKALFFLFSAGVKSICAAFASSIPHDDEQIVDKQKRAKQGFAELHIINITHFELVHFIVKLNAC